jgi:hypothetical protein
MADLKDRAAMSLISPTVSATRLKYRAFTHARLVTLVGIAATLLACVPFLFTKIPNLIDYPNHLARLFVLTHYDQIAAFHQFYKPAWMLVPNIAMDAVIVPIVNITGWAVESVDRDFTMLVVAAGVPATMLLSYAFHRRWSLWSAASILFTYNYVLLYGFTNYVAGINLAVAFAALWMLYGNRKPARAAALFSLATLVLFFAHLYALVVYGAFIGGYELWQLWETKPKRRPSLLLRQAIGFLQFLPPLVIFFFLSPTSGDVNWDRIKASTPALKAMAVYTIFDTGHREATLATFAVFGAAVAYGFWTKRLKLAGGGATILGILGILFIAMPFTLFGCGFADYRLPIAMAPIFLAATEWKRVPKLPQALIVASFALLALGRTSWVAYDWHQGDRRYDAIISAMAPMPEGQKMLGLVASEDATMDFARRPPIEHAPTLAVIARHAFVPTLFAEPQKQPLEFRPALLPLTINNDIVPLYDHPASAKGPLGASNLAPYDYVMIFAKTPLHIELPANLTRVDDGSVKDLALFKIRH